MPSADSRGITSILDLRTGKEEVFTVLAPVGQTLLVPPTQGKGCDWVLILDAVK